MACGCNGGKASNQTVRAYQISDDPNTPKQSYLTERDAMNARTTRGLSGTVDAVLTPRSSVTA
jgi:hypothetical protein